MTTALLALGWGAVCVAWLARFRPVAAARTFALAPAPRSALRELADRGNAAFARFLPSRRKRALLVAVERDLGDVVALVGLAVSAGCNLRGALEAASTHSSGALTDALRGAVASADRGQRIADALEPLPDALGETVRGFVAALISCDRYGAPLGATLDRLALDVRTASRQRAEAAARRLPVRLLFPLVTCILPAFALLTVAPLIAGSFQGLAF